MDPSWPQPMHVGMGHAAQSQVVGRWARMGLAQPQATWHEFWCGDVAPPEVLIDVMPTSPILCALYKQGL